MKRRQFTLKPRAKVAIALAVIFYFSFIFVKQELIIRRQYAKIQSINKEIAQVQDENNDFEHQIKYTESNDYVEKVARERLGWVKEDEIVFIEDKKNDNN